MKFSMKNNTYRKGQMSKANKSRKRDYGKRLMKKQQNPGKEE
jgi:hypothetical protein